ncbi:MAG: FixH family protein [Pseudomonadota bacterium]|nr:FixH family protein [Pseudomonadota bacterium]
MHDLLFSLALGVALIVMANAALVRFTPLSGRQAAAAVALATLAVYLPLALLRWPGADVFAFQIAVYLIASYACGFLQDARERAAAAGRRSRLHWAPAAILGFFAVLLVVNVVFVTLAESGLSAALGRHLLPDSHGRGAVSTAFPGPVSHDYQKQESLYNAYLHQVRRQQARGWQVRKGWLQRPVADAPAVFKVAARTRDGAPLTGAEVAGRFLRPSDSRLDTPFVMQETGPGVYQTEVRLAAPGQWNLVLELRKNDERHEIRARTSVGTPAL